MRTEKHEGPEAANSTTEATQRAAIQKIELSTGEETGRRKLVHEELRSGRFLAFDRCGDVKEVNVMA